MTPLRPYARVCRLCQQHTIHSCVALFTTVRGLGPPFDGGVPFPITAMLYLCLRVQKIECNIIILEGWFFVLVVCVEMPTSIFGLLVLTGGRNTLNRTLCTFPVMLCIITPPYELQRVMPEALFACLLCLHTFCLCYKYTNHDLICKPYNSCK